MVNIHVKPATNDIYKMYDAASTKEQRALLGKMVKAGLTADPFFCGAFNLLCEVQSCKCFYLLETDEDPKVADRIVEIAEKAMSGGYNKYALSNWAIIKIMGQIEED